MSDAAPARPRQVTVAAWLIILGSVFVVFSAFGQVSAGSSLETRERIETLLSEPPAEGLGLAAATGALVASVIAEGPARKAGIAQGDVITKWDGKTVARMRDLPRLVAATGIGETVEVEVEALGGRRERSGERPVQERGGAQVELAAHLQADVAGRHRGGPDREVGVHSVPSPDGCVRRRVPGAATTQRACGQKVPPSGRNSPKMARSD